MLEEAKVVEAFEKIRKEMSKFRRDLNEVRKQVRELNKSEPKSGLKSELKPIEKKAIKYFRNGLKERVKDQIYNLLSKNMRTSEIEEFITKEKRLCKRTAFYMYLNEVKTEIKSGLKTIKVV